MRAVFGCDCGSIEGYNNIITKLENRSINNIISIFFDKLIYYKHILNFFNIMTNIVITFIYNNAQEAYHIFVQAQQEEYKY